MNAREASGGGKSLRPVVGATLLFLLGLLALGGVKSYRDLTLARERVRELEAEILAAEQRIQGLQQEILLLKSDPHTLERRAREDLGLARPGELVILLPQQPPEEDPVPPPPGPGGS